VLLAVFIPGICGGFPPPIKILTISPSPKTAAKLCALNLFFGQDSELLICHRNFLLTDNKHRKLFVIKQSKGANLCLKCTKIRLAATRTRWGSSCTPPDPLATMWGLAGLLLRWMEGRSEGDGNGGNGILSRIKVSRMDKDSPYSIT